MADIFREKCLDFTKIHITEVFGVADCEYEIRISKFKMADSFCEKFSDFTEVHISKVFGSLWFRQ